MSDQIDSSSIVVRPSYDVQLREFEEGLLGFLDQHGLPTTSIFVSVDERLRVFKNVEDVLALINDNQKNQSVYISKFVAAAASGLFDAALNYQWDETIYELRRRVAHYDLSYLLLTGDLTIFIMNPHLHVSFKGLLAQRVKCPLKSRNFTFWVLSKYF